MSNSQWIRVETVDGAFDAYLDGTLHYVSRARAVAGRIEIEVPRRVAAASGMLLCAL